MVKMNKPIDFGIFGEWTDKKIKEKFGRDIWGALVYPGWIHYKHLNALRDRRVLNKRMDKSDDFNCPLRYDDCYEMLRDVKKAIEHHDLLIETAEKLI